MPPVLYDPLDEDLELTGPFRRCRVCGCTDEFGCGPDGCVWVEPDLCSMCDSEERERHRHSLLPPFRERLLPRRVA